MCGYGQIHMNNEYLSLLSPKTKELLAKIESHIESEVIVKLDSSRTDTLACEIENFELTILTPNKERFLDDSVFHELLHFERFCISNIPRMIACDDYNFADETFETKVTAVDNNLEHFVIVPTELQLRPNRTEYWEKRLEKKAALQMQGLDLLIDWAFAKHILPEANVSQKLEAKVSDLGFRSEAEQLLEVVLRNLHCKPNLVKSVISSSNIPQGAICLEYLDFKHRRASERSLITIA